MRRYAVSLALLLLASPAGAQTGVNLATTTSTFLVAGSPSPGNLGAVDFHFSYTFPGADSPLAFTIAGITGVDTGPADWFTVNAANAASLGIDWPSLVDDYANHRPPYGQSAGPNVSIDTDLGTFSNQLNGSKWNFIAQFQNDGVTPAHMVPDQLQVRITRFSQSTVDNGTVFAASTTLSGFAYLAPEPSSCAMLLPIFGMFFHRRYHG